MQAAACRLCGPGQHTPLQPVGAPPWTNLLPLRPCSRACSAVGDAAAVRGAAGHHPEHCVPGARVRRLQGEAPAPSQLLLLSAFHSFFPPATRPQRGRTMSVCDADAGQPCATAPCAPVLHAWPGWSALSNAVVRLAGSVRAQQRTNACTLSDLCAGVHAVAPLAHRLRADCTCGHAPRQVRCPALAAAPLPACPPWLPGLCVPSIGALSCYASPRTITSPDQPCLPPPACHLP